MNGSGRSTEYETIGVGHNLSATTRYYPARQFDPVSNAGVYIETQAELVFKLLCSGTVTNTIEHAAVKDYKTTPAAGEWTDITSQFRDMAGASAASYVDATKVLRGVVPPGRVRVKSVTADATNDVLILMAIKPCDSSGVVPSGAATDAGGSAYVRSAAAERYCTVLGAACTLTSCRVYNSGAALLYLVVVDQVAAPTTGVTACFPLCEVAAGAAEIWNHSEACTLGCHVCLSTNPLVYTDPGAVGYFAAWRV